jgi:uncharacterized protein (TIGR02996 family)
MHDAESLLAAIAAEPDDDLPRLAYADWLDEHGLPHRAELIRLQCQAEREGGPSDDEDDRAHSLIARCRAGWTAHLPQTDGVKWHFRRGFPEAIEIEGQVLLDRYDAWAAVPQVRNLGLLNTTAFVLRRLARNRWPANWVGLSFNEEVRPWMHEQPYEASSGVAAIVGVPQAAQLRELRFWGYSVGEGGVRALCESPFLDGLRVLGVSLVPIDGRHSPPDPRLVERFGKRLQHEQW